MKYKVALIIVLAILYLGLLYGIYTLLQLTKLSQNNIFLAIGIIHIAVVVVIGICALIAWLWIKAEEN